MNRSLAAAAVGALFLTLLGPTAAHAGPRDSDGDGIPNRFERNHGMRPFFAGDAKRDFDRDGLRNLAEYRRGSKLRDEDTDDDGHDDGDEARDGVRATHLRNPDTDGDGILDGDEDSDRDGIANEDEDDGRERCRRDDDDRDGDHVDDEDENDLGLKVRDDDSDDDGILDGDEDDDEDGEANEDEDDLASDRCDGDFDGDGEADEDEEDRLGTIGSFDGTWLVINTIGDWQLAVVVTEDTEVELEYSDEAEEAEGFEEGEGSTADLVPGVVVAEVDLEDDGTLEEIEIYAPAP